jgi:glycosyltransferase 2 family protein
MPQPKQTFTRRLLTGIIFGFLVVLALALVTDIRQVKEHIFDFQWKYYPAVVGLTFFNYLLRGIKFHCYLRQVGADRIALKESFRIFFAGFPLAVTPGKAGEALKGVWIRQATGIPTATGISVVLAERISDGLAVLLLSVFGVMAYPQYWPVFLVIFGILIGLIIISQIRPAATFLLNFASQLPLLKKISPRLREFYEGSYTLYKPGTTIIAVILGIISWLGEGIGFYLILIGLGIPSTFETLGVAIFVLSFSTIVGAVSALPGGLGAAEASISGMLILFLGISSHTAAAATLLIRFATLWFGVGLGLSIWAVSREFLQFQNRKSK